MKKGKEFWTKSFYCGDDEYCERCRVCRYLNMKDSFYTIALPEGSTYERDEVVEIFIELILPAFQREVNNGFHS